MFNNTLNYLLAFLILLLLYQAVVPMLQKRYQERKRIQLIHDIEQKRHSRVITIIHREETITFFNIPIQRSLNIEDSEQILEAIYLTPPEMPIDILLHTPGGLVLAAEQIAFALKRHTGKVTVFIPHYAMSGGTMIALVADEIVMSRNAVIGALDPQLGSFAGGFYPAISIINALKHPNPHRDDQILILGDIAEKAVNQVHKSIYELLLKHQSEKSAERIAENLTKSEWTHDYPLIYERVKQMRLPVSDNMPVEMYELLMLYIQPSVIRRAVEFIPTRYKKSE